MVKSASKYVVSLLALLMILLTISVAFQMHSASAAASLASPFPQPTAESAYQIFQPLISKPGVEDSYRIFLPFVSKPSIETAYRIGYANTRNALSAYNGIESLQAGWYTNWSVAMQPLRPNAIEYVQMIRVHQKLSCGEWFKWNRETCPYSQPLDYVFKPDITTIRLIAQKNPNSIWLIGNEMDRVDFSCGGTCSDGQDEMVPETYARAYHDLYQLIKDADPSAQIAVGGLIQATPLRLQWLTIAWDTYQTLYEEAMPVDIWNVHNFILQEDKFSYGAAVPPGLPGNPTKGEYIGQDYTHTDPVVFDRQIRAMRQWMKDRGQQEKPLVITEYGVLYSHVASDGNGSINFGDPTLVHDFMSWTFDYFLDTKDCALGFTTDDCRLVQRWLWFSLDHAYTDTNGNVQGYFNTHTSLFDATTKKVFPAGEIFRDYVRGKFEELAHRWLN